MANKSIILFLAGVALSTAVGLAHSLSYRDEIKEQEIYCANVAEGIWPDYKKNFEKDCK